VTSPTSDPQPATAVPAPDPDPLLSTAQVAARAGCRPGTWRAWVARRDRTGAPEPDDPGDLAAPANRRNPRWRQSRVDAWLAARPGKGTRTDLQRAADPASESDPAQE
jgi:hypothetical protein